MANETTTVVKNNEPITRLLEMVEKHMDQTGSQIRELDDRLSKISAAEDPAKAEIEELKGQLTKALGNLEDQEERLRNLDKQLPVGSKVYQPVIAPQSAKEEHARDEFARMVFDLVCKKRGDKPRFDSLFSRGTTPAQVEATGGTALADGGYLMPIEMQGAIVKIIEQYGVARRLCRIVPMRHRQWEQPTNSDLPAVWWDTELDNGPELSSVSGGSGIDAKVTFAKPQMTAHKLISLDTLSIELEQDSLPDVRSFVVDQFATAFAKEEDYQFLTSPGTGNEPFTGLTKLGGIAEVTSSEVTYEAALKAIGADSGYNLIVETMDNAEEITAQTGIWVFSNSILNGLRYVKDAEQQPLFGMFTGSPPGTLLGRPYVLSRVMPKMTDPAGGQSGTAFILFGDYRYHVMGDRMQMSVDVSEHAAFKEAGIVLRFMERIGFVNQLTAPFSRLACA